MSEGTFSYDPNFDAYKALGLDRNATREEVEKAYKKIARANHPDTHPGDPDCEKRFKEASRANAILSNPTERKKYDSVWGQVRTTVHDVAQDPRVNDILNKAAQVLGGRPTPTVAQPRPQRTRPTAERTIPRSPVEDRARRVPTRPSPGPNPMPSSNDPEALLKYVFKLSKSLRDSVADGDLRDRDQLVLASGVKYNLRRVLYTNPNDSAQYRSVRPVLCRGDEVLAPLALSPGQGLTLAGAETCKSFAREMDDVAKALLALITQRGLAQPMAQELRAIMEKDESVQFNGMTIRPRTLGFVKAGVRTNVSVMCANFEILEVQPGDPVDGRFRYADAPTARTISANYMVLRGMAAAQAKAKGRDIPAFTQERVRNTVRATTNRVVGWLGD